MNEDASHRFKQAAGFLAELVLLDPAKSPRSTTHLAYYAMFHAASGVVAAAGARTVKTHAGLSTRFSQALHRHAPEHLDLVGELTRAFNARLLIDYDDGGSDPVGKAIALADRASAYVESCMRIAEGL